MKINVFAGETQKKKGKKPWKKDSSKKRKSPRKKKKRVDKRVRVKSLPPTLRQNFLEIKGQILRDKVRDSKFTPLSQIGQIYNTEPLVPVEGCKTEFSRAERMMQCPDDVIDPHVYDEMFTPVQLGPVRSLSNLHKIYEPNFQKTETAATGKRPGTRPESLSMSCWRINANELYLYQGGMACPVSLDVGLGGRFLYFSQPTIDYVIDQTIKDAIRRNKPKSGG